MKIRWTWILLVWLASTGSLFAQDAITEEELTAFGKQIEQAVLQDEVKWLTSRFDQQTFADRVYRGIEVEAEWRNALVDAFPELMRAVMKATEPPVGFSFRKVYLKGETGHILCRALMGGGMNFYDMRIRKMPAGDLVITDMFIYLSGEDISVTMRRAMLPGIKKENAGLLDKMFGKEDPYLENIDKILLLTGHMQAGRHEAGLKVFDSLPKDVQNRKSILIAAMNCAAESDDKRYMEIMERLKKHHPADPALSFILIDFYYLKGQKEKTIEVLDNLLKRTGEDGYIESMKGGVYLEMEEGEKSCAAFEKSIEVEPMLEDSWWAAIEVNMQLKRYERIAELLTGIEKQFDLVMEDLETVDYYAEFVKSEAYKKWKAEREAGE